MIFASLRGKSVGYVNLNTYAEKWLPRNGWTNGKNPLLVPEICNKMVRECHLERNLDWSYGGWLEDRSTLWKDSYLEPGKFIHLGVDFNAPVGTRVMSDHLLEVLKIDTDTPLIGGWGTRVIAQIKSARGSGSNMVLLYAHLDPDVSYKVGDLIHPNAPFAKIGKPEDNGGWYSHVHVQAMTLETYRSYESHPDDLDGYGHERDIGILAQQFRDPLQYIRIF